MAPIKPALKRPASETTSVSPPPAKRVVSTATKPGVRKLEPPAQKYTTTGTSKPTPAKPTSSKSPAPVEPIPLVPREIPRAPASHGVRYRYILKHHQELTRLHNDPTDQPTKNSIIQRVLDAESEIATTKRTIYTSAMGRMIMRLTKLTPSQYAQELSAEAAKHAPTPQPTAPISKNHEPPLDTGMTPEAEISLLQKLVHKREVLKLYDYILAPPTPSEIAVSKDGLAASNYEQCDRCAQRFQVFPGRRTDGALTTGGECVYHPGKSRRRGPSEQEWTCCKRTIGGFDRGCRLAQHHVYLVKDHKRLATTLQYIVTPPNPRVGQRALAFDCEMCYTTLGMEVCRLTATAFPSGELVLDALVRPFGEVLDFNTQFSGVTAEMMTSAEPYVRKPYPEPSRKKPYVNPTGPIDKDIKLTVIPSPLEARNALLKYIAPDTVLIGHALNNDLGVLRLCHDTVVDTMILFPHSRGFPMRNRLKYLVSQFLGRSIQVEDDPAGHDSAVDARCAAELCRLKIRDMDRTE